VGFVWEAEVGAGLMRFAGSDGYHAPEGGPVDSWTKFWLHGLVPLARSGATADHASAALTRRSLSAFAAFLFLRTVDLGVLLTNLRPPPRRASGSWSCSSRRSGWSSSCRQWPRAPLPGQTIFVLDLAFALPLVALTAVLLWRGSPAGDMLAIPMLMKVAVLGLSVFLGTFYTWAFFDGPFLAFDLALYALMGFGPAALIWPVWHRLEVER